ncbi:MAG: hypothetical protein ACOCUY_01485 [Verrucomicrobiota bacterium]
MVLSPAVGAALYMALAGHDVAGLGKLMKVEKAVQREGQERDGAKLLVVGGLS